MRVQLPPRSTVRNGQVVEQADTRSSEGRAHRGVRVQVPPWSLALAALVVKRTSRDCPKVEAQVRLLAGVLSVKGACVPTGGCRFGEPCSPGSSPGRSTLAAEGHPRGV